MQNIISLFTSFIHFVRFLELDILVVIINSCSTLVAPTPHCRGHYSRHMPPLDGVWGRRLCLDIPSWGCSGVLCVGFVLCAAGWVKGLWFRHFGLWWEGLTESWNGAEPVKRVWGTRRTRISEKHSLIYTLRMMRSRDFWAYDWVTIGEGVNCVV